ncbi:MAG: immunoglobulin domain-containing protein, partial [Cytophagales bacterium]|nr:immunoglobulin domain-containing protein [Cytophagales bacterium]
DGEGVWTSETIDISGAGNVTISLNAEGFGGLNGDPGSNQYDYFRVFYILDGGAETNIASFNGALPFTTITSSGDISGSTLQIVLRVKNTGLEEQYVFDQVSVFPESVDLGLVATGGSLSCHTNSVTLTASATTPGATYSWTGPGSFTSIQQNPLVSTPGSYTVTATAPDGCSQSATVALTAPSNEVEPLWEERFAGLSNGTIVDNGPTSWSVQNSGGTFSVQNNKFIISNNDNEGVWQSEVINISGKASVNASVRLTSSIAASDPGWDDTDHIKVFYRLNGGGEIAFQDGIHVGKGVNTTATASWLSGNTLQIVVRGVTSVNNERYFFDDVKVSANTHAGLEVTATAGGILTCGITQVNLSTNINPSDGSFSWVGPGGFSSAQASPFVSTAGDYAVTVRTASGCAGTAIVTVGQDITPPDVSAGGGNLSCDATTINLTASSSTPGVTYSWTGPGGFVSTEQNPGVSVAGQYVVTVTNPVNGCFSKKTVAVTNNDGQPIWVEAFDLSDGTSLDTGSTAWSTQITPIENVGAAGPTFFEVRSGEFYVFNLDGE